MQHPWFISNLKAPKFQTFPGELHTARPTPLTSALKAFCRSGPPCSAVQIHTSTLP